MKGVIMITGIIAVALIIVAGFVMASVAVSAETYLSNQDICGCEDLTVFNN